MISFLFRTFFVLFCRHSRTSTHIREREREKKKEKGKVEKRVEWWREELSENEKKRSRTRRKTGSPPLVAAVGRSASTIFFYPLNKTRKAGFSRSNFDTQAHCSMTGLLRGGVTTAAASMRPAAAVSGGTMKAIEAKTRSGSASIAARRRSATTLQPLLPLRPGTSFRGQLAARASGQSDSSNLESALARIEKLEAENRKLRELLLKGDDGAAASAASAADDDDGASAAAAAPAPAAASASAAPLPTSLQFQAAEQPATSKVTATVSTSSSSIEVSNIAWPEPGERFWERSPTKTPKTFAAASARPFLPASSDDMIVHIGAELAPRVKVGGLGDVVSGFSRECAFRGLRTVVVLPFYECVPEDAVEGLELVDEFPCPKGKAGDGGKMASIEQLGVSAFSGRLDGIEVLLLRPDWSKSNLFRGGKIYGGSYNDAEA